MFFPLILRLVELQRYGYKPMLSPREALARVTSQTHASITFITHAWVINETLAWVPYPTHKRILSPPLLALQHE